MSGYYNVERGTLMWDDMWSRLAAIVDIKFVCPTTGEGWQYMGTVDGHHQFRHRSYEGRRNTVALPVQDLPYSLLTVGPVTP